MVAVVIPAVVNHACMACPVKAKGKPDAKPKTNKLNKRHGRMFKWAKTELAELVELAELTELFCMVGFQNIIVIHNQWRMIRELLFGINMGGMGFFGHRV